MPSDITFDSPQQHTLALLELALKDAAAERLSVRKALDLSILLHSHGHPAAGPLDAQLKENAPDPKARAAAAALESSYRKIRTFFRFEKTNPVLMEKFYRTDGYLYLGKDKPSKRLLVIFTSIFNNLYFSNAMIAAMLSKLDCDLLFLKDSSRYAYLQGASGIAGDFTGIGDRIQDIARKNGIKKIFVTGFSSAGFAALLTALRIPCAGYLGFSQSTDRHPDTMAHNPNRADIFGQADPRWKINLRTLLEKADPAVPRALYYGELNQTDVAYARNVEGLSTIRTFAMPNIGHNTIRALFAMDMLLPAFETLVNERTDWPVPGSTPAPQEQALLGLREGA
ncbi:MAG: hypothetical protein H6917_12300 [Novosphingobium sp.]|nr:hypothetical protein [Novosphingobium sp.]MCP5403151.1 hypothetical protein [Novosphingobium sp.]